MTGVSALGPWPGHQMLDAQSAALGELTDLPEGVVGLPPVVQLPSRSPWAESVARTASLLPGMPVELGVHGWKLADRPGRDLERTQSLLREDLDALAVAAHGYSGPLAVSVRGPWTLAAILYLARGDRVLSDAGAVHDVVGSLGEGLADVLASLRSQVPGAEPVVVLREPMLPDVLGGTVATFSGRGRISPVSRDTVTAALGQVVAAARGAGATGVVAHGGARFASRAFTSLTGCGADAVGVAAEGVRASQWEQVATAVEGGQRIWFGLPRNRHGKRPEPAKVADLVSGPWRAVGLPAGGLADVVVHVETSGSVAGGDLVLSDMRAVRSAIGTAVRVAAELAERSVDG